MTETYSREPRVYERVSIDAILPKVGEKVAAMGNKPIFDFSKEEIMDLIWFIVSTYQEDRRLSDEIPF